MDKQTLENAPFYLQQAYKETDPEQYADAAAKVRNGQELPEYLVGYLKATLRIVRRNIAKAIEELAK